MTFEDWMNEIDYVKTGHKRSDTIYSETVSYAPEYVMDHWMLIKKWLKTAYICGKIDGSKYNMDVIAELQNRLKGHL